MAERSKPLRSCCLSKTQLIDLTFYWSLANVDVMSMYGGSF